MIHPEEMRKVSLMGPRSRMETVIERLHDLNVLHIDEYTGEEEDRDLEMGDPRDEAEALSDTLVRLRSLKSRLPDVEETENGDADDLETALDDIGERIADIEDELDDITAQREEKQELLDRLRLVERLGLDLDDFRAYEHIDIHLGTASGDIASALPDGRAEVFQAGDAAAVFVDAELDVAEELRDAGFDPVPHEDLVARDTSVADERAEIAQRLDHLDERAAELEAEREELGRTWRGFLEEQEDVLAEDLEKAEAPLRFATTDAAFVAEGWIPAERADEVVEALNDATEDSIYIELSEAGHDAPVEHDNPDQVEPLESLISLYGTPSYGEVDPTFLLLTFPLLFGFMLADIGYGLTSLAVFGLFAWKFPEAKELWYSLMYASIATIGFGLLTGEMFGFLIFGQDGILTQSIPILFHREHMMGTVLAMSVGIGVVHINLGYLVGAYNEYLEHGVMEAVFAKLSWIVLEIGAVVAVLTPYTVVGAGVAVLGAAMLYRGEHIEGIVEIPSLLSNILSYLRIFGVIMAVLVLAKVVNGLAMPLFQSGSVLMIGVGVLVLVVGHLMNTFLKVMECGLQGIRLHYVEFFTKFFEGGGVYYKPFGAKDIKTR